MLYRCVQETWHAGRNGNFSTAILLHGNKLKRLHSDKQGYGCDETVWKRCVSNFGEYKHTSD